ncbi:MAG: hypothetical protein HKN43_05520 [Rhodothermales bacterium]|nr:hypothetical protein [Rhodothermales bacterium]
MRLILSTIICLFAVAMVGFVNDPLLDYFRVEESNSDFVITWETVREDGVKSFELHRKTPHSNDEFVLINEATPIGPARQYVFRDTQVFKSGSELIDYRLQVVLADGSRQIMASRTVNYTPTAIRRTWGSIKAMF